MRGFAAGSGFPERSGTAAMYRAVTHSIEVVVTPRFVADRSSPDNNYFF